MSSSRPAAATVDDPTAAPSLAAIVREWGRIGCVGFGGPPAHIALLRELCVTQRRWISEEDFEHGVTATNLLPGPASTQLAIYCAWRLRGAVGALVGGVCFIAPGLVLIILLAILFLGSPPEWVLGIGAGAGAVVAAVAVHAGIGLMPASFQRARGTHRVRWIIYVVAGVVATVALGPWLVLVLLGCGVVELIWRRVTPRTGLIAAVPWPLILAAAGAGGLAALCWTAFKVGALSYGGGFVIIPLQAPLSRKISLNVREVTAHGLTQIGTVGVEDGLDLGQRRTPAAAAQGCDTAAGRQPRCTDGARPSSAQTGQAARSRRNDAGCAPSHPSPRRADQPSNVSAP